MTYVKTIGLLAAAAAALMAFVGTASATVTSPAGLKYSGEIGATSTNAVFDGTVDIACSHSEFRAFALSMGGTTVSVSSLTFTGCNRSMTQTAKGHLFIHSNGTITSAGARFTVQTTILGFPVHCIYATNNTDVGRLTEGISPGVIHIDSDPIPQEATSSACGDDAEWTGTYTVTIPKSAFVVD